MKFFKIGIVTATLLISFQSCKKDYENNWNIEVKKDVEKVKITDISKDFFDESVPLDVFKKNYPWFQGSVKDEDFINRRKNPEEINLYKEAISKINLDTLSQDLAELFARTKHYFPNFKEPKVFAFSSSTQMFENPIIFDPQQGFLFIDISCFIGEKSKYYKGIEEYFRVTMSPNYILPKISEAIAFAVVPFDRESQKYLDMLIYQGKVMVVQDALIPQLADHYKMSITEKQMAWNVTNESGVWNFFVENDYLFSPDPRLEERFISAGPFSKFYTEIDAESSPRVGVFSGWQLCKSYLKNNEKVELNEFIEMNAMEIFNKAQYKP